MESIRRDWTGVLRFAQAVAEAEELVRRRAAGFGLAPLYPELPAELSGLVELAYDTNNQASVRFIEPLAYESAAYAEERQSVQLSLETGVERPFILSTPRLSSPDVLELAIPFRHPGLDELVASRVQGTTLARLREMLGLGDGQAAGLERLLADQPDLAGNRHIEQGPGSGTSVMRAWSCRRRRRRWSPIRG